MERKIIEKGRWELEEPEKEIIVPTLKEKNELKLTNREWALICYLKYKDTKCFREYSAQPLCSQCPKSGRTKIDPKLEEEITVLATRTTKRLARLHHKRPYYRR